MKRWLFVLFFVVFPGTATSQSITVGYRQTISIAAPGVLAAYSLDDFYAEAKAQNETLLIFGKNPGAVLIVEVTRESSKTFEVLVVPPPRSYPPGFVLPSSAAAANENGSFESRYTSNPSQSENILDFMRREGDRTVRFHLGAVTLLTPVAGRTDFALSSAFYQILTPERDITVLDQLMANSPLTVDGTIVRGFHLREGGFLFHIGYASLATFENVILPVQKEGVIGMGYRILLGDNASLTPNLYYFPGRPASEMIGQRGSVTSLVYNYRPNANLGFLAEVGFSRGFGAAARFHFAGARDQLNASLRYEPVQFASLSLNSLHGFYSDVDWTRYLTSRLTSTFAFMGDHYMLSTLDRTNVVSSLDLRLQVSRNWSLISGSSYGDSKSRIPVGPSISTFGVPIGITFYSAHFQSSLLYQYSKNSNSLASSDEYRASLGTHWNGFHLTGFADRQTEAPTIDFGLAAVPGLQQALDSLALSATSPTQIALALRDTAGLASQGLIQGINFNVSPLRYQAGSDLTWSNHATSPQQMQFNVLYNRNDLLQGDNRAVIATASYSIKLKNTNEIFGSLSLFRTESTVAPGWRTSPLFALSIRRHFDSTPNFIIPRRRGTISGVVFADDGATGTYHSGGPTLAGVEVVLDDARKTHTDLAGRYIFPGVSYSSHVVEIVYRSAAPFFFTTASRVQSDADSEINFGVGLSMARLFGFVRNDSGIGLANLEISVSKGLQHFSAHTDDNGKFRVEGLSGGEYDINLDLDSVPGGYSLSDLKAQQVTVDASTPAEVSFTLKAIRNISGRVTIYDRASSQGVPVTGVTVLVPELSRASVTDDNGIYLFRDLPAGPFTVFILYKEKQFRREVVLTDAPSFPKNIDINLGTN
jgi:hypothetical protein